MPAIRSQRCPPVLPSGFEVETVEYGKRRIEFVELPGNDVTLTAYLDDIQVAQDTLSNPSLPDLYAWIGANLFPGSTISADGKTVTVDQHLYISWHVVQRNPLDLRLLTSNAPPPDNWWQS